MTQFEFFRDNYLANEKNLVKLMNTMASQYKNISIEAYHVFKLFVAFEPKPEIITKILKQNSKMLIDFIKGLLADCDDEESQQERDYVLMTLGILAEKPEV